MFAVSLTAEWDAWVAALTAPLHPRSAGRLAHVILGILLAHGGRTVASWWRAAGIGKHFGSYYFLGSVGRKATAVAVVVFGLLRDRIDPGSRWVLAIGDTPTKWYGPKVQGAGSSTDSCGHDATAFSGCSFGWGGRPQRFGATQGGGGTRWLNNSPIVHRWSVRPAAIAGVRPRPFRTPAAPVSSRRLSCSQQKLYAQPTRNIPD